VQWRMVDYKELPGNIGYVALNDFGSNDAVKQWGALLPKILATNGLILDLRLNGGGSSSIGYDILASLVTKPFLGSRQVMRTYNPTHRARGASLQFTEDPPTEVQPRGQGYGTKPIVVLTGPATYSAAEDFMVAWKNSRRGKTIGEPTGGSTGQPLFITLPGGGTARICTKRDTFPDGTEWVGKGIEPDIVIRPTIADVQAGKDPVLEAAIRAVTTN
jgi:carboxyl-terminal processing protease